MTYAEDYAFAGGYYLMLYGDVHLANPCSFVGNVGFRMTPLMIRDFLDNYQIKASYVTKGENKVRLNRLKDFTEADKQWVLGLLNQRVNSICDFAAV